MERRFMKTALISLHWQKNLIKKALVGSAVRVALLQINRATAKALRRTRGMKKEAAYGKRRLIIEMSRVQLNAIVMMSVACEVMKPGGLCVPVGDNYYG